MIDAERLALFALAALILAATPGPVWIYLVSRTLAQGRAQRWFLGGAFGALAAWLALDRTPA